MADPVERNDDMKEMTDKFGKLERIFIQRDDEKTWAVNLQFEKTPLCEKCEDHHKMWLHVHIDAPAALDPLSVLEVIRADMIGRGLRYSLGVHETVNPKPMLAGPPDAEGICWMPDAWLDLTGATHQGTGSIN